MRALVLLLALGCIDRTSTASARKIESVDQAIGGPVASARTGDLLLENDRIRVVIEQAAHSRTPLGVGGTIIDADVVRTEEQYRRGRGLDQLGQIAATANLYVGGALNPGSVVLSNTETGAAEVTARAEGVPIQDILAALNLLLDRRFLGSGADYAKINLYTEYELRPGEAILRVTTTAGFEIPFCPPEPKDGCNPACDDILYDDDCTCAVPDRCRQVSLRAADRLPDRPAPAGISDILLGDLPRPLGSGRCSADAECGEGQRCTKVIAPLGGDFSVCRAPTSRDAGVMLGDMLLFGGHLSPFLPGIGFDTESDIRRLFDAGEDTLSTPLDTELVLAVGDGVSYGFAEADGGRMLIPIFGGPFSMGATGAASCTNDDPACLARTLIRSRRLMSVGRGDASSALRPLYQALGRPIAELSGAVLDANRDPIAGADVFLLAAPRGIDSPTLDELFAANRERTVSPVYLTGHPGIASQARTDPRGDTQRDGRFVLVAPPGDYYAVAIKGDQARSSPVRVTLREGTNPELSLSLPRTSRLSYALFDSVGRPVAGRISVLASQPSLRPIAFGGPRVADRVVAVHQTSSGRGSLELAPGDYEVVLSHGPHWSIDRQSVRLIAGEQALISATLLREVDRAGFTAADFHVHAEPSLDSNTPMKGRMDSFLAEDLDRLSSSDHDILTRYAPHIRDLGLSDRLASQVGVEVSTQELGHFIGFPLEYREREAGELVLGYGAPDWRGAKPGEIFDSLRALEDGMPVVVDVPHPYSYFDAYAVDPFTMEPTASIISLFSPLVAPENFVGTFDAMELLNSKGFDLVRRATVGEVRFYSEGFDRLIAKRRSGELDQAGFDFALFQLSTEATRRMLERTDVEQNALLAGVGRDVECRCGSNGDCATGLVCDQSNLTCVEPGATSTTAPRAPDEAVCRTVRGVVDDWFDMLNRGVVRIGVGGSDVHSEKGGYDVAGSPRVMVETGPTDPASVSDADFIAALRESRVVVTNGPMIRMQAQRTEQKVQVDLHIEAAAWYDVDRVELYRNAELIRVFSPQRQGAVILDETIEDQPPRDAWYVAIALGLSGRSLAPVYSSAVLARFGTRELIQRIYDIVPRLRGLRLPRNPSLYPTFPFAITNPIFIDMDGGGWTPPLGPPSWCVPGKDAGCR